MQSKLLFLTCAVLLIFQAVPVLALEEETIDFEMPAVSIMKAGFIRQVKEFSFESYPIAVVFDTDFSVLTQSGKIHTVSTAGEVTEVRDHAISSPVSFAKNGQDTVILHDSGRTLSMYSADKKVYQIDIQEKLPYFVQPYRVIFINPENVLLADRLSCYSAVFSIENGEFRGILMFRLPGINEKHIFEDIRFYDDCFYILVQNRDRIMKFDRNGNFLNSIAESGFDNGNLNFPTSLEFDEFGNLYVADCWNNRIVKYAKGAELPFKVLKSFGRETYPSAIALSRRQMLSAVIFPWKNTMMLYDMDLMKELKACFASKDFEQSAAHLKTLIEFANKTEKSWIIYYLAYLDFLKKNYSSPLEELGKLLNKDLQRDKLFYKIYKLYCIIRLKAARKI